MSTIRRFWAVVALGSLLAVLYLLLPGVAHAADQVVNSTGDAGPGSLRQAIQDVHDGGTITFNLAESPATITLTGGELAIAKSLTIAGPGADRLTISCNDNSRCFLITTGTVILSNLTIAHGRVLGEPAEGGAIRNVGNLTLQQVTITASRAQGTGSVGGEDAYGGGLFNAGTCLVDRSTIYSNTVQGAPFTDNYGGNGNGGGIHNQGVLTLTHSLVQDNLARGGPVTGSARYGGSGQGGGLSNVTGTLTIEASTVVQNRSEGGISSDRYGGSGKGAGVYNDGTLFLQASTIMSNTAQGAGAYRYGGNGYGGGLSNQGTAVLVDSFVLGNLARGKAATVEYCGSGEAGGIFSRDTLTLLRTTVRGNIAQGADGPVAGEATAGGIEAYGNLHIEQSTVCENRAVGGNGTSWAYGKVGGDADAGGIYSYALEGATHLIISSTVCSNLAQAGLGNLAADAAGGGIYSYVTLTVEASTIVANLAQGGPSPGNGGGGDADGGGLYSLGNLSVLSTTVQDNAALGGDATGGYSDGGTGRGGGIGQGYGGAFAIMGSTIVSNTAQGGNSVDYRGGQGIGGGFSDSYASYTPTLRILNTTFYDNRALRGTGPDRNGMGLGGGLSAGISAATLSFCTIYDNTADDQGGGLFSTTTDDNTGPAIKNTILAGNIAPTGPDLYANVQSRGFNLIQDAMGGTLDVEGNGNTAEGNLLGLEPKLGPLQDNGGPTWTCALLIGDAPSPAIAAGSSTDIEGNVVAIDQRGFVRPSPCNGNYDMGAFELQSEPQRCLYLPQALRSNP